VIAIARNRFVTNLKPEYYERTAILQVTVARLLKLHFAHFLHRLARVMCNLDRIQNPAFFAWRFAG
jgi:hypothetical protein